MEEGIDLLIEARRPRILFVMRVDVKGALVLNEALVPNRLDEPGRGDGVSVELSARHRSGQLRREPFQHETLR